MTERESLFDAREFVRELHALSVRQWADWMHFHELAMTEPFKAESEAQAFALEVQRRAVAAAESLGLDDQDLGIIRV